VAAVSGGADSVALLLLLKLARRRLGFTLRAAHVDHGLRGAASKADAEFVAGLCKKWRIKLDRACLGLAPGPGAEARAREGRLTALARIARRRKAGMVLLGHHQGDQAETVLMHLARGSGFEGLAGLRPLTVLVQEPGVAWARPLLGFSHAELEAFLHQRRVAWREDLSNHDEALRRNLLRARVLPELESAWPGAGGRIAGLAARVAEAAAWMNAESERAFHDSSLARGGFDLPRLRALPMALRGRVLRLAAADCAGLEKGIDGAATARLAALVARGQGSVDLLKGWQACAKAGVLRFEKPRRAGLR